MVNVENSQYSTESINRLLILNELGDEMIGDMINAQLENPIGHNIYEDYLTILSDRQEKLVEEYGEGHNLVNEFADFIDTIYNKIRVAAEERFGLTLNTEGDPIMEKIAIENIYRVFFLEYQDTLKNLVTNYIYTNRKGEIQSWVESKKDIASSSARKTFKDSRDALIMSNISSIISKVLEVYLSDDECVSYMLSDESSPSVKSFTENYNAGYVSADNLYENLKTPYMIEVENDSSYESILRAEVQQNLYNNFPTEEINIVGLYDPTLINND